MKTTRILTIVVIVCLAIIIAAIVGIIVLDTAAMQVEAASELSVSVPPEPTDKLLLPAPKQQGYYRCRFLGRGCPPRRSGPFGH